MGLLKHKHRGINVSLTAFQNKTNFFHYRQFQTYKQLNTTTANRMITSGVDMVLLGEDWGSSGKMVS